VSKYLVITDPESAVGFRLAGVETLTAERADEAEELLQTAVNSGGTGLLLINESFMNRFSDALQRKLEKLSLPLIIPIPISSTWWKKEESEDYIFNLIRRAIGYQMKIKKG
jgi:V/A-type H+-transporting ATPase subunit F